MKRQLLARAWLNRDASRTKLPILLIGILAFLLATFGIVVAAVGEQWLPLIGIIPLALVAITAFTMYAMYSNLTRRGQEAAIPWRAYRAGLERAAKDDTLTLELDAVLADAVAMNLGSKLGDRLKRANESGETLRAFTGQTDSHQAVTAFPWWVAFSSTVTTSSGGAGTVSGAGAGGGGGAAGST